MLTVIQTNINNNKQTNLNHLIMVIEEIKLNNTQESLLILINLPRTKHIMISDSNHIIMDESSSGLISKARRAEEGQPGFYLLPYDAELTLIERISEIEFAHDRLNQVEMEMAELTNKLSMVDSVRSWVSQNCPGYLLTDQELGNIVLVKCDYAK